MTTQDDLGTAARHLAELRDAVASLQAHLGDTVDIQRLRDDVARVAADLNLVARSEGMRHGPAQPGEIIYIPDEDYDTSFWSDADDEGLGATGRAGIRVARSPPATAKPSTPAPVTGVGHPGRARIPARTLRTDRYWVQPAIT